MATAEELKAKGNEAFKAKDYDEAIRLYTLAIQQNPNEAPYYTNRALCYLNQEKYDLAIQDCDEAIKKNPAFLKSYIRKHTCCIRKGDLTGARQCLNDALLRDPVSQEALKARTALDALPSRAAEAASCVEANPFRALSLISDVLAEAPGWMDAKITRARALFHMKKYETAIQCCVDILSQDRLCLPASVVRGKSLLYTGNLPQAISALGAALQLDPDNADARQAFKQARQMENLKKEGNDAYGAGRYQEAADLYGRALTIGGAVPSYAAVVHGNRGQALAQLNKHEEAVKELSAAIELDDKNLKSYLRRANSHTTLGNYKEAVYDLEKARELDPENRDINRQLREAQVALKRSEKKDFYKVLEVPKTATQEEIKKSYRKLAMKWHPDRHQGDDKKTAEAKFKDIGEAYSILSDEQKRRRYDLGEDDEMGGGPGGFGGGVDVNELFARMFGGGGGGMRFGGFPGGGFGGFGGFPGASFRASRGGPQPGFSFFGGAPGGGFGDSEEEYEDMEEDDGFYQPQGSKRKY